MNLACPSCGTDVQLPNLPFGVRLQCFNCGSTIFVDYEDGEDLCFWLTLTDPSL